jgi:hypothetical protein
MPMFHEKIKHFQALLAQTQGTKSMLNNNELNTKTLKITTKTQKELIDKLEYWHSKNKDGFYKFSEPCNHHLYRLGDSWCEELNVSENTLRKYMKPLCNSFPSKKSFQAAKNSFDGKPYVSYFDRLRKITFFFRNPSFPEKLKIVEIKLSSIEPQIVEPQKRKNCGSTCGSKYNKQKIYNIPPKSPLRETKRKKREEGRIKINLGKKEMEKAEQARTIWLEETQGQIRTPKLTPHFAKRILDALSERFSNCLVRWRAYCKKVASSKFLMGKVSSFKAWLIWVLRADVIEKIKQGMYGIGQIFEDNPSEQPKAVSKDEVEKMIEEQSTTSQEKTTRKKIMNHFGEKIYHSWFSNVELDEQDLKLTIKARTGFVFDTLRDKFEEELCRIFINKKVGVFL